MKLLILTQYFPPETGAPQNRLLQLAKRLENLGVIVTVLTAMPNYPKMKIFDGYRRKFYYFETIEGIPVHRCWIYAGTSKAILLRLINYFSFVKTSFLIGLFKIGRQDLIFCESPPLFLGISAWLLTKFKRAQLIFNVSDLWPESAEKLGLVTNRSLLNLSTYLEEFLYRHSVIISGQTQGIVKNISSRFPEKPVLWLKNGADSREINNIVPNPAWRETNGFKADDFILVYAGIIGHAQGLEVILNAARLLKSINEVKFLLVGSGPVRDKLMAMKEEYGLSNVIFVENCPKPEVIRIIHATDATVIPLRRLDLFKGAIPSKIFENLALRKPILLGVEGEAKEIFIDKGKAGWAFEPESASELANLIRYLSQNKHLLSQYGENGYQLLLKEFDLDIIAAGFLAAIQNYSHERTF
ncbi:MAG: glycosyltransferase family 4 protein [Bacteroidetes bacterium]|nr:glycosyltransferase family 4 protein [Bacteroidota bacterium]